MPHHYHPKLRALEELREQVGLLPTLDSAGVAARKVDEANGKITKPVPVMVVYAHGVRFVPS